MNGRIYDPTLGRFLQADPFIQAPKNSQNYNRYSYVLNNPLSYTDPSGYFFSGLKKFAKQSYKRTMMLDGRYSAHKMSGRNPWIHTTGMAALNFIPFFGQLAAAHASFDHTLVNTGSLRAAATSGVYGLAASYAAMYFGPLGAGIAGGIITDLQGGKFGHGFWSAYLTTAAGGAQTGNPVANVVIDAVIGGTISKVTGGKFANGAQSAAFASIIRQDWSSDESKVATGGRNLTPEEVRAAFSALKKYLSVDQSMISEGEDFEINYDPLVIAEIVYALDKLGSLQGENFWTSQLFAPERAMLMRVMRGKGDNYTLGWYRHEEMESSLLRNMNSDNYLDSQETAHLKTLRIQQNSPVDYYHPSVVRFYDRQFGPAFKRR